MKYLVYVLLIIVAMTLGSAVSAKVTVIANFDFEDLNTKVSPIGKVTINKDEVIFGNASWKMDATRNGPGQWSEYFWSDTKYLKLKQDTCYRVRFDYKILGACEKGDYYYFVIHSWSNRESGDIGATCWDQETGLSGKQEHLFYTGMAEDRYLAFGVKGKGLMIIDNIIVEELEMDDVSE